MKTRNINAILTLAVLLVAGCASQVHPNDFGDLPKYEKADPYSDLEAAIKREDLRFKSLNGLTAYVPDVEDEGKIKNYGVDLIQGSSDFITSYEHGRLIRIAQYYAEAYNAALLHYINSKDSKRMSMELAGYAAVASQMTVEREMTGDINLMPYSFHATLVARTKKCASLAWWFDPISNGKPQYDWLQFLTIYREVDEATCQHKWIQEWIHAGSNRAAEAQIFGVRPHTESDFDWYVSGAWSDAHLNGEPYFELLLRENDKAVGTIFISKDLSIAIITSLATKPLNGEGAPGPHWLDGKEFHYHPKAETKEFIVVNQSGEWTKRAIANVIAQ